MQEWVHPKLEEPHAGSGEGFLCSSSPHPVPKRALKPPGHLGASSGPSGHMVHAEGPVSPRSSLQGQERLFPGLKQLPRLRTPGMANLVSHWWCVTIVSLKLPQFPHREFAQLCKWVRAPVSWVYKQGWAGERTPGDKSGFFLLHFFFFIIIF